MQESIRDFYGRVLGYIETLGNGDQVAKSYGGRILGYYYKNRDTTCDVSGKVVAYGNAVVAFLFDAFK